MTEADKEMLLNLVTRISMWIHPVAASSAVNFIRGYEAGTKNRCDFTAQLSKIIEDSYNVNCGSLGWPEQIRRLAKRRHSTWLIIFRRITLEVLVNAEGGSLVAKQQAFLRKVIVSRINRVESTPPPWLSDDWVDDWRSLCAIKSTWFRQLWTRKEWTIIKAIDKLVQTNGIFKDEEHRLPSSALLELKEAYDNVASISEDE